MYTYAFLTAPSQLLELPEGIEGTTQLVVQAQLAALVEPGFAVEQVQTNDTQLMRAVLSHDRVIAELFQQTTVLPLRFGTQFVSHTALVAHLKAQQQTYLKHLAQLTGKAEYILKLTPLELPELPMPSDLKGREYFLAKKQQFQAQQNQQNQQRQELADLKQTIAQTVPRSLIGEPQEGVGKVYLLIDRTEEAELYRNFQIWQTLCPHWELDLSEALAPYHFV